MNPRTATITKFGLACSTTQQLSLAGYLSPIFFSLLARTSLKWEFQSGTSERHIWRVRLKSTKQLIRGKLIESLVSELSTRSLLTKNKNKKNTDVLTSWAPPTARDKRNNRWRYATRQATVHGFESRWSLRNFSGLKLFIVSVHVTASRCSLEDWQRGRRERAFPLFLVPSRHFLSWGREREGEPAVVSEFGRERF